MVNDGLGEKESTEGHKDLGAPFFPEAAKNMSCLQCASVPHGQLVSAEPAQPKDHHLLNQVWPSETGTNGKAEVGWKPQRSSWERTCVMSSNNQMRKS